MRILGMIKDFKGNFRDFMGFSGIPESMEIRQYRVSRKDA